MSEIPNQICWCDIPVTDLDRAIAFYSAVLGREVSKESEGDTFYGLLPHCDNQVSGCLTEFTENTPSKSGPLVYLNADGRLDEAIAATESHGGSIIQPRQSLGPHGHRAVIIDSEGNRIALHSH